MDKLFNSCTFLQIMNNLDKLLKPNLTYYTIYIKQPKYYSCKFPLLLIFIQLNLFSKNGKQLFLHSVSI